VARHVGGFLGGENKKNKTRYIKQASKQASKQANKQTREDRLLVC